MMRRIHLLTAGTVLAILAASSAMALPGAEIVRVDDHRGNDHRDYEHREDHIPPGHRDHDDRRWRDRRHHAHQTYIYEPSRPAYVVPPYYQQPYAPTPGLNLNVQIP